MEMTGSQNKLQAFCGAAWLTMRSLSLQEQESQVCHEAVTMSVTCKFFTYVCLGEQLLS